MAVGWRGPVNLFPAVRIGQEYFRRLVRCASSQRDGVPDAHGWRRRLLINFRATAQRGKSEPTCPIQGRRGALSVPRYIFRPTADPRSAVPARHAVMDAIYAGPRNACRASITASRGMQQFVREGDPRPLRTVDTLIHHAERGYPRTSRSAKGDEFPYEQWAPAMLRRLGEREPAKQQASCSGTWLFEPGYCLGRAARPGLWRGRAISAHRSKTKIPAVAGNHLT